MLFIKPNLFFYAYDAFNLIWNNQLKYFSELKRRNIFKVAAAYLALGWVVIQITDVVVPALNLPNTLNSLVVYLGIIGFPFALFFAWAYELTPDGVKRTKEVDVEDSIRATTGQRINFTIIGLLCIAVFFLLFDRSTQPTIEDEYTKSIAVLPFVNMSEDENNEYFSDGLSEEILNVLGKLPDLRVAARTSSFSYKGQNNDLRLVGDALGVDHLLEGSVRKQNNRVRITAQLIRTVDGFNVWSETYNRELRDIFIVQEEIANAIGNNLALEMDIAETPSLITTRTENMQAYDLYLEGKMLVSKRGVENVRRALDLLNQATKLDPEYAPAWGMLAQAHSLAYYSSEIESTIKGMFLGEEAARRALRIDPESSHAHSALGDILKDKYQWKEAEEHYIKALQFDPDNVESIEQFGQFYMRTGKFAQALPYVSKATEMDPQGQVYYLVEAMVRNFLGLKERSLELLAQALEVGDGTSRYPAGIRFLLGSTIDDIETSRHYLSLLLEHNEIEDSPYLNAILLEKMDDKEALLDHLERAFQFFSDNPELLNSENAMASTVYATLAANEGDYELAIGFIEIEANLSIEHVDHDFLGTSWIDALKPLHNNEKFKETRHKYGLVEYWKYSGWPDICRATGENDFECQNTEGKWPN